MGSGKLAESLRQRRGAAERWVLWAAADRPDGPLIWVHGASVGETLTAEPVVRRLRAGGADPCVVHSYSSPSMARWPDVLGAARSDYAPADTGEHTGAVLDAVRPALLVFSRGDVWPELVLQAAARSIPVAVIGGTVRPRSLRLSAPVRSLYAPALNAVSWLGAASEGDAERWQFAGVPGGVIEVSGDPRHDHVLERLTDLRVIAPLRSWADQGRVLVAGSVEPEDEEPVLRAAATVLRARPDARLLLVPHDPTPRTLDRVCRRAARAGIASEIWSPEHSTSAAAPCIIVGGRGALYHLFALAAISYVGGGFRRGRVHAAVEPAAYALPVLAGSYAGTGGDGERMAAVGALVTADRSAPAPCLAEVWLAWLNEEDRRVGVGLAARRSLSEGASSRTAARLRALLPDEP